MQPFYGVPVHGSLLLYFALTALYAFTNAGLGLLAGTFARNSAQVGLLVMLMVMPMVMLSGTHTPLLGIMQPFYGVPVHGSLLLYFALTALYAFTNAGLGLLAGTFARTSAC
jgi:ABC-2 type transport system permease protein